MLHKWFSRLVESNKVMQAEENRAVILIDLKHRYVNHLGSIMTDIKGTLQYSETETYNCKLRLSAVVFTSALFFCIDESDDLKCLLVQSSTVMWNLSLVLIKDTHYHGVNCSEHSSEHLATPQKLPGTLQRAPSNALETPITARTPITQQRLRNRPEQQYRMFLQQFRNVLRNSQRTLATAYWRPRKGSHTHFLNSCSAAGAEDPMCWECAQCYQA